MIKFYQESKQKQIEELALSSGLIGEPLKKLYEESENKISPPDEEKKDDPPKPAELPLSNLLTNPGSEFIPFVYPEFKKNEGIMFNAKDTQQSFKESHFNYLIIGPPGSGKSTLLMNIIKNQELYYQKFNKVLFITQSVIVGCEDIQTKENTRNTVDDKWIMQKIFEFNKLCRQFSHLNLLIIFDDVIATYKQEMIRKPFLQDLIINRRHLLENNGMISMIFTAQKYSMLVPTILRNNISGLIMFKSSEIDWDTVNREFWGFKPNKLRSVLSMIYNSEYMKEKFKQFIFLFWKRNDNSFFVNFNQIKLSQSLFD
jgi:GTPase SAR1 family protein